ncbi:MAG: hypothetical protein NZ765_12420 [Anaerolineae bacterium]|nr:hypothetical protein [Anaerolineae bacterium]
MPGDFFQGVESAGEVAIGVTVFDPAGQDEQHQLDAALLPGEFADARVVQDVGVEFDPLALGIGLI